MFGFNCQTAQGMFTHASSWRRPGTIATGVRGYAELGLPPFFSNRQRWKWVPGQARDDSGFLFSDSTVKQREDVSPRSRGAKRPSFANFPPPFVSRGRRESRVRAAPAVSCANCAKKCAHEHTGEAEAIRLSLRDGLRLTSRSPRRPAFLPPSSSGYFRKTWRQHRGARTTRLRRPCRPRSSVAAFASTASHRAFVTIATRPSHRVRRAESNH
jgi:hypothetical protein